MKYNTVLILFIGILALGICVSNTTAYTTADAFVCRGEKIRISAYLLENITYGNPIPNQILYFFDQTENTPIGSALTDSNGYAAIDWIIPVDHSLGPTLLNVTFLGNDSLFISASCQYLSITIMSKTELQIGVEDSQLYPDDILEIEAVLKNDIGFPISNASLSMYNNDELIITTSTNSTGYAQFKIQCNDSWCSIGENLITIMYEGDIVYYQSEVSQATQIQFQKISTELIISTPPDFLILGETYGIDIVLNSDNSPLPNSEIAIFFDDQYYDTIFSDSEGRCLYNLSLDESFSIGTHSISFSFFETEKYSSSIKEFSIDIKSYTNLRLYFSSIPIINNDQKLFLELSDEFGRAIPDTTIILFDLETKLQHSIIVPNNTTSVSYYYPLIGKIGPRIIDINVTGNRYLLNSTCQYLFSVWDQTILDIVDSNIYGFASPQQEVTISLFLSASERNISLSQLTMIYPNNTLIDTQTTNQEGYASFSFIVPNIECNLTLIIIYQGNSELFELQSNRSFSFIVSKKIPLNILQCEYDIVPALQEIQINFKFILLNGTFPSGLILESSWLDIFDKSLLSEQGTLTLHLNVPTIPGNYTVLYTIIDDSIMPFSGQVIINISEDKILASQGVGISTLTATTLISTSIIGIPIIRRWYLIG